MIPKCNIYLVRVDLLYSLVLQHGFLPEHLLFLNNLVIVTSMINIIFIFIAMFVCEMFLS